MKFITKTTAELTVEDLSQLCDLFLSSFKRKVSADWFKRKYTSTVPELSCFHGFMINGDHQIVGAMTIIPFKYQFFKEEAIFGNLIDLMIHPDHRKNILNFKCIYDNLLESAKLRIDFLYAVPNPNSFLYFTKILRWVEIGKLNYYFWPLKLSKITKLPPCVDTLFTPFGSLAQNVIFPIKNMKIETGIKKVYSEIFFKYRYPRRYKIIQENNNKAWYDIVDEKGTITAYIIDVVPQESAWFSKVIKTIHKEEKHNIDVILYISNKGMRSPNIIKVPKKYEPRPLPLTGKIINTVKIDERIFEPANWTFNLSDFDVR